MVSSCPSKFQYGIPSHTVHFQPCRVVTVKVPVQRAEFIQLYSSKLSMYENVFSFCQKVIGVYDSLANLLIYCSCTVDLYRTCLQRELADHQEGIAVSKENVAETFGADSEQVLEVIGHQRELEPQLEEAGKLAALLQAEAADHERCQSQLDHDVQSLVDWLSGVVEHLNQLSVNPPSESDDEVLRRHNAVKVTMLLFRDLYKPSLTWNSSCKVVQLNRN